MKLIAADILREILLKLPAGDVGNCRCVSRRWRCIIDDSSFRRLHARASHAVAGSGGEALLVSHDTLLGKSLQNTVLFNVSSTKPMPMRRVEMTGAYRPASVCNGFILLTCQLKIDSMYKRLLECLLVWNPATGEKLRVPAPPMKEPHGQDLFAMGFSGAPRRQYKLFRLPSQAYPAEDNYVDVYTLGGGGGGWRRHPDPVQRKKISWAAPPPILVDGKLYVLAERPTGPPDRVFVIDVATEARRMYNLMEDYKHTRVAKMNAFELAGRLCVAVRVPNQLHLWVMPPPCMVECGHRQPGGGRQQLAKKLPGDWELRYSFNRDRPASYPWAEDDGTLCCVMDDHVCKYEDKQTYKEEVGGRRLAWERKHRLPPPGSCGNRRWHIYGGYCPTLLSPRDLETQQQDHD